MTTYQATTLKDLKQTSSGIHVKVDAMLFSGRSDKNGGCICSLAKDGDVVPATIDSEVYGATQKVSDIYAVQGRWNGTQLEVHHAKAKGLLGVKNNSIPKKPMYSENSDLQIYQEKIRKKKLRLTTQ